MAGDWRAPGKAPASRLWNTLIETLARSELGGQVDFQAERNGVRYKITATLEALAT